MDFSVGRGIRHYLFHYIMSTVNKVVIHNKLNKSFKMHSHSNFTSNSRPLESFQFAQNSNYVIFKLTKIVKIGLVIITMD